MNPPYSLILQEGYADDVETAIDWYENQSPGLGRRFVDTLFTVQASIEKLPGRFPPALGTFRKSSVSPFPYDIYYLVDESNQLVYLIALIHQRRSQAFIRKRLRKKQ